MNTTCPNCGMPTKLYIDKNKCLECGYVFKKQWLYNIGEDDMWADVKRYDSFEEAKAAAIEEYKSQNYKDKNIYVGEIIEYTPVIDAKSVIACDIDNAWDEVGAAAEDYLYDIPDHIVEELDKDLKDVYYNWIQKHGNVPEFGTLDNIKKVEINNG